MAPIHFKANGHCPQSHHIMGVNQDRFVSPQKAHVSGTKNVIDVRVARLSRKYLDGSLTNQGAKQQRQFDKLSKNAKREWREALQRNIAAVKDRLASRVLSGIKLRGKTKYRWKQVTALEEILIYNLKTSSLEVDYQGFGNNVVQAATAVAIGSVAVKAHSTMNSASKLMSDTGNVVHKTDTALDSFVSSVHSFVDKIKSYGAALWKPCLIGLSIWILKTFAHVNILTAAIVSIIGVYLPEVKHIMSKYTSTDFTFQSGDFGMTADIITMICTVWIPGRDAKMVTGDFMKRVSNFPRASEGMETFLKKVLGLVEQFLNFVLNRTDENKIVFSGRVNAFENWRNQVIDRVKYMAQNPTMPIAEIRKIKDLQILGLGFYQVLTTNDSKRELNYWMEKLNLALSPHEGAIHAENNMRPMPSCLIFGGESGAGKTTLLRYVASIILLLSGECSVKDALENLWQKGTTEYWNGYIAQKCLVMDDCFQVKPKAGDSDSEAMQIIRAIGNWSMPLNFADLNNKGKIYLDSPLVVGTTNCRNIHAVWSEFITEPKALTRRFQTAVWVKVNPEYADVHGRFDFHRINDMFASAIRYICEENIRRKEQNEQVLTSTEILDCLPWHVWKLYPHSFDRETISDTEMPGGLRAIVENTAREIQQRKATNRDEIKDITSLLAALDDALAVDVQSGLSSHFVTNDDACEVTPVPMPASSSDFDFGTYQKLGTNVERAMDHYNGLEAEKEYDSILHSIVKVFNDWQNQVEMQLRTLGLSNDILVGLAKSVITLLNVGLVVKLLMAAISALSAVFSCILRLFGIKPKVEATENAVKSNDKFIQIASFNEVDVQVGVPPDEHVQETVYMGTLKCVTDESDVGQFIGLGSDVYLFPKHYLIEFARLPQDTVLTFIAAKDGCKGTMTVADFMRLRMETMDGSDIAAVSFGVSFMKAPKRIIQHFLTQHELKNLLRGGENAVRLDVAKVSKNGVLRQATLNSPTCYYHGKAVDAVSKTEINSLVRYMASTMPGDCGAPLTLVENRNYGRRCVIGFHSAGRATMHGSEGFATVVSQEVARELFTRLRTYTESESVQTDGIRILHGTDLVSAQTALRERGVLGGSFQLIGELEEPVNMPTKTKLKKSDFGRDEVFGTCPVAPAALRPTIVDGELRDPMVQGIKAYQTDLEYKDVDDLMPIVDLAMQKHWEATQHYSRDILSFEEAVKAPEGWKLKPINRKTSPGYRYAKYVTAKKPGKTAFFGLEGEYEFDYTQDGPLHELAGAVDDIIYNAENGIRQLHLCTDFLKDELRPTKKVLEVATRVISATPVDYTIAVRMYFGAYAAAMFSTYVKNGMAPGINQYTQWFTLVDSLHTVGKNIFDGDFSRFDASEQPWIHEGQLRYINRWYKHNNPNWDPVHDKVRAILWLDLVHSRHITGTGNSLRYVVQWNKSLPSGHPLTTIVNSMYSLITLTGCYMITTGDLVDMWKHAYIVTFGDDNISSVDDETKDLFNQVTVAKHMKEVFGLTYTPGNKSGVLVPYTTIENTTFLKRSFKEDISIGNRLLKTVPGLGWVGPLAKESFLYVPYWYKNARTPTAEFLVRVEQMLCELCLYDQDTWDLHFTQLEEWCVKHNVQLKLTSRESTRLFVEKRLDVWF